MFQWFNNMFSKPPMNEIPNKGNMMQEDIYSEIKRIFDEYESFVIAIKGSWGSGKTYFWNQFKSNELSDKQYAYVSLFGKDSLEEIKRDMILQISVKDKHLLSVKEKISDIKSSFGFKDDDASFGVTGAWLGTVMSLFEKKDFENVVLCIDDFERKSSKLDIRDILGYLSVLKEQFNCKVVLILNEEKISQDEEIYREYKEKIVDFEFSFVPSVNECFEIVEPTLVDFKKEFLAYCVNVGLKNIRVMQRSIRLLNRIAKDIDVSFYHEITIQSFVNKTLSMSIPYYRFGFLEFDELSEYYTGRRHNKEDEKPPVNDRYESILSQMMDHGLFYHIHDIDMTILDYFKTSVLNTNNLLEEIKKLDANYEKEIIKKEFFDMDTDFLYDLDAEPDAYIEKIYTYLEKHYSIIFQSTSFGNFKFYIDQLILLDPANELKYLELLKSTAIKFIDVVLSDGENAQENFVDFYGVHIFEHFKKEIPEIETVIDEKLKTAKTQSYNCEELLKILKSINQNQGLGSHEESFINCASKEFYTHCFQNSEILRETHAFIRENSKYSHFKQGLATIWKALNEIEHANTHGNAYKIQRIKQIVAYKEPQPELLKEVVDDN